MIADHMRGDPEIFARGVLFAILSIRQKISNVPAQMEDVAERDSASVYLFGFKRAAFTFLMQHRADLWRDCLAARTNGERIDLLCQVPGLGIVKAAFVLQLMGYDVACLDSRNVKREGRNPRAFRTDGQGRKTGRAFLAKITRYLTQVEGKAETYWDDWCADVADAYGMTPEEVSGLHLAIIPDNYIPF